MIIYNIIDIQNLMTSAITNKSSKTRDFEKWGMVDPIATYNEADECDLFKLIDVVGNNISDILGKDLSYIDILKIYNEVL